MPATGGRPDAEAIADLEDRVDRFHADWRAGVDIDLRSYLPLESAPHRGEVLLELVKTDMERRAEARLDYRIERYLDQFPNELRPVSPSLPAEEFRLRQRHGTRPDLEEYRRRFPEIFPAIEAEILRHTSSDRPRAASETVGTTHDGTPSSDILAATGKISDIPKVLGTVRETPATGRRTRSSARKREPDPPPVDTLPAEVEYKLLKRLGKGSYGEVYEALAPGGFRVAVKRILRSVDHPSSASEVEALEVVKSMSHPFLVQTHAYWVFKDRLVIVMELADGSLSDRIKFHKDQGLSGVPTAELLPYFEQAAEALDYLHSCSVSHRDIKPENLLVLQGYAKVADFGLAREHSNTMTEIGMEVGTPMYMAPEVWRRRMSLHSDQYSLAGTYITARLGKPPYSGRTIPDLYQQHAEELPELGDLPEKEKAVLLKAMAKKPEDRFPSCVAFATALREAVEPPKFTEPVRKRRYATIGLALLLVLALTALVYKPTPAVVTPPVPEPEPVLAWIPDGWSSSLPPVIHGGKPYAPKLERVVDGETLVAILIPAKRPGDPPPFYMTRDKVTNRVFRAVWDKAERDPQSSLHRIRGIQPESVFPGRWRKGAITTSEKELGIEGGQLGVPVVGVTMAEAKFVAEELGGKLPTYEQWFKAVGAAGDGVEPGPAGAEETAGEDLSKRPLALCLKDGPWPISRETKDMSVFGLHQLTSNGTEWTEGEREQDRISLLQLPTSDFHFRIVGFPPENRSLLTFKRIADDKAFASWTRVEELASFRLVLMPPR